MVVMIKKGSAKGGESWKIKTMQLHAQQLEQIAHFSIEVFIIISMVYKVGYFYPNHILYFPVLSWRKRRR